MALTASLGFGSGGVAGGDETAADRQVALTADVERRICIDPEAAVRADLMTRRRVPVIAVSAFTPAAGQGGGGLLAVQTATGQETRIGFFPGGAFSTETDADPQRFFLPDVAGVPESEICYALTLLGGEGARALVQLGVSDPLD